MHGVLVIDKPRGPTSFDVVRDVRRALGVKKVGHTGTLDPMATGVLPICLGEATKIAQLLTDAEKRYEAVLKLGAETDTLDAEGSVTREVAVPALSRELLERAASQFRGTFLQTPPMYSAIKMGGKRLYELARAGEEVERKPREVTVHSLDVVDFSANEVRLVVKATKGFFVRSLAFDLGRELGSGAHLVALRRLESGRFTLAQALPLEKIVDRAAVMQSFLPLPEALGSIRALTVDAPTVTKVRHGGVLEVGGPEGLVRVMGPGGELLALADVDHGRLRYRRVFSADE